MRAVEATDAFVRHWVQEQAAYAIINYVNCDMVGHTGVIEAAVTAVETVDECLGRLVETVYGTGGACVITADHSNADHMLEDDGSPITAHSLTRCRSSSPPRAPHWTARASSPTWRRRCWSCSGRSSRPR
jgi:2,3-bisphosphoglycerate-independent phosphoglycerate mutase